MKLFDLKPTSQGGRKRQRIMMISTHGYVAANPPLGAPDTGGQVVFVLELSKKLAQLGYRVDIWTRQFEGQKRTEQVEDHVQIIRMPCGGRDFIPKEALYKKLPEWGENALRHIEKNRISYSFINSHYWDAGLAGQHLAEVLQIPHIHTPHSIGSWKKKLMEEDTDKSEAELDEQFNFGRRIHHERILFKECDLVVATSPPQVDVLRSDYEVPRDHIRMIPPGYDDNRFFPVSEATRESIRERFGLRGRVIASLGRLARNKGFDLLVDSFKVVADREPDAVLRLAVGTKSSDRGDDDMLKELETQIDSLGLRERVILSDSIPDEDMADFYRAADVFALSSRYEPFGMTAVEAMACGTPTVLTTNGGLYRAMAFGRHALFADTLDREEFGIALFQALKYRRLREQLHREGAHHVRSLFTWTGIAQQLLSAVEGRSSQSVQFMSGDI